jgi:hypothetical protein
MKHESGPRSEKTDDQIFEDIRTLTEKEGWHFHGNMFQADQTYQLILSKKGEEDKVLYTKRPYPKGGGHNREGKGNSLIDHSRESGRIPTPHITTPLLRILFWSWYGGLSFYEASNRLHEFKRRWSS